MPEQMQHIIAAHYAVWVVHGAWWIVDLDTDEVLMPECPPPWPAPSPN